MSKYINVYETVFPEDTIAMDDPRRGSIINEMRRIHRAKTLDDAKKVIAWWFWATPEQHTNTVKRIRRLVA